MTKYFFLSVLVGASLMSADTLLLRNGSTVDGSFAGGDSRSIRFTVGNQVNTYSLDDVDSIRFSGASSSAPTSNPNNPAPSGEAAQATQSQQYRVQPNTAANGGNTGIQVPAGVVAPDGTEAEPVQPSLSLQVARTVGRPLLSRISLAFTCSITNMRAY
jgi:hypothetical protein